VKHGPNSKPFQTIPNPGHHKRLQTKKFHAIFS
jgi:hypothetical protein